MLQGVSGSRASIRRPPSRQSATVQALRSSHPCDSSERLISVHTVQSMRPSDPFDPYNHPAVVAMIARVRMLACCLLAATTCLLALKLGWTTAVPEDAGRARQGASGIGPCRRPAVLLRRHACARACMCVRAGACGVRLSACTRLALHRCAVARGTARSSVTIRA